MATSPRMEICVVYLAWAGAGPAPVARFATSLRAHPAGPGHTLLVAWKGYEDSAARDQARRALAGITHEELMIPASGLDLSSYRTIADQVSADAVCFLNTDSEVLANGWLDALSGQLSAPGVGLVGATGSYESQLTSAPLPLRLLRAGRYPPFPNPHLRTNAFMLRRATIRELWWPAVARKRAAWELESGNRSLTRQILERGQTVLVVGRDGHGYPPERWRESATFRVEDQPNLLVSDKRTRDYAAAEPRVARVLSEHAWGRDQRS
jgi:hypothetical protein